MADETQTTEQSELQDQPIAEAAEAQPAEEPKKPCSSCTIDYINKKTKENYLVLGMSVIAMIALIWVLKKAENPNKLWVGILMGALGVIIIWGIKIQMLMNDYKKELLNQTQPIT